MLKFTKTLSGLVGPFYVKQYLPQTIKNKISLLAKTKQVCMSRQKTRKRSSVTRFGDFEAILVIFYVKFKRKLAFGDFAILATLF